MAANPTTPPLRDRLRSSLTRAMKERDRVAVAAIRSALSAIENAESIPSPATPPTTGGPIAGAPSSLGVTEAPRRDLSDDELAAIVRAEIDERRAAATTYASSGADDRAARLDAEAAALERVLDSR